MVKVAIVTGASKGLGRGIAKVLAEEESATVYATARSEEALNELASSIEKGKGVIHPFVLDQTDDDAVEDFVSNSCLKIIFYYYQIIMISSTFHWACKHTWKRSAKNTGWCLLGCAIGDFGTILFFQLTKIPFPLLGIMILAIINLSLIHI